MDRPRGYKRNNKCPCYGSLRGIKAEYQNNIRISKRNTFLPFLLYGSFLGHPTANAWWSRTLWLTKEPVWWMDSALLAGYFINDLADQYLNYFRPKHRLTRHQLPVSRRSWRLEVTSCTSNGLSPRAMEDPGFKVTTELLASNRLVLSFRMFHSFWLLFLDEVGHYQTTQTNLKKWDALHAG